MPFRPIDLHRRRQVSGFLQIGRIPPSSTVLRQRADGLEDHEGEQGGLDQAQLQPHYPCVPQRIQVEQYELRSIAILVYWVAAGCPELADTGSVDISRNVLRLTGLSS